MKKMLMNMIKMFILFIIMITILGLGCLMMFGGFIIYLIVDMIIGFLFFIAVVAIIVSLAKGNDKE